LSISRDNPYAELILGNYALWVGDYATAISYLESYLARTPDTFLTKYRVYYQLAYACKFSGMTDRAEYYLGKIENMLSHIDEKASRYREDSLSLALERSRPDARESVILEHMISARQAKEAVRSIREAERGKEILLGHNEVFIYGIYQKFSRMEARAYSEHGIDISKIGDRGIEAISADSISVYGEFRDLETQFVVKRSGIGFCSTLNFVLNNNPPDRRLGMVMDRLADLISR
jgi:tetratricopeptide (TPR) repeat protein